MYAVAWRVVSDSFTPQQPTCLTLSAAGDLHCDGVRRAAAAPTCVILCDLLYMSANLPSKGLQRGWGGACKCNMDRDSGTVSLCRCGCPVSAVVLHVSIIAYGMHARMQPGLLQVWHGGGEC